MASKKTVATEDTSRTSCYITSEFYRQLLDNFSDWAIEELASDDLSLRDRCGAFLYREARLLDLAHFEEWLQLFSDECVYWVPGSAGGGDPRREVAICFDDRRRLEDRVYRIRTGYAWSQIPQSRTARLISNVEVFNTDIRDVYMVRSLFSIHEFRAGDSRVLAGWCGHRLLQREEGFRIQVKQVNLIDCDQNLRNPSVIF